MSTWQGFVKQLDMDFASYVLQMVINSNLYFFSNNKNCIINWLRCVHVVASHPITGQMLASKFWTHGSEWYF